jgi:hypothetical protein
MKPQESFPDLLARRAPARDFSQWFRDCGQIPMTAAEWVDSVIPAARAIGGFDWMAESQTEHVRCALVDFVIHVFTKMRPSDLYTAHLEPEMFQEFLSWMESRPDSKVVRFCWELLAHDRTQTPMPVNWLEWSGRLKGPISRDATDLAVSVTEESDAMFWWPDERWNFVRWDRDSQPYFEMLSHSSYLVRAAAAKAVGQIFLGLKIKAEAPSGPPLREILAVIQELEIKTPGVAGPFLHGAGWQFANDDWAPFIGDMDMKAWFLETLRRSGQEPDVPCIQSLEFYAHELFANDGRAIQEFLIMGRKYLAVMTATQAPQAIPMLRPVLEEMASSADPEISAAIGEYLTVRSHHVGSQHVAGDGPWL